MKSSVKISRGQIENVFKEYETITALLADQANQSSNRLYKVIDASDDPNITFPVGETKKHAYYEYKETPNSDIGDYDLIGAPFADGGSGGGVQSVTGDGVGGTAEDVVLTFPTPMEIGAIEDAPSDGKQYARKDANWDEVDLPTKLSELDDDIGATDAIVPTTIFIDTLQGDDDTGVIRNRDKPFKTWSAAVDARPVTNDVWTFFFLRGGAVTIDVPPPHYSEIRSKSDTVFNFKSSATFDIAYLNFDAVKSTINLNEDIEFKAHELYMDVNIINHDCANLFNTSRAIIISGGDGLSKINVRTLNKLHIRSTFSIAGGTVNITQLNLHTGGLFKEGGGTARLLTIGTLNKIGTTLNLLNSIADPEVTKISRIIGTPGSLTLTQYGGATHQTFDFDNTFIQADINLILTFRPKGRRIVTGQLQEGSMLRIGNDLLPGGSGNAPDRGVYFNNFDGHVGKLVFPDQIVYSIINSNLIVDDSLIYAREDFETIKDIKFIGFNTVYSINQAEELAVDFSGSNLITINGIVTHNFKTFGRGIDLDYITNTLKEKKGEVIVRSKYDLINRELDNSYNYIIDGNIILEAGDFIIVPEFGDLTISGYGLEASVIEKNAPNEAIFVSSINGSGGMQIDSMKFKMNTPTTTCFDISDASGFNAVECLKVNFEGAGSIGNINGYRQGLWSNIGLFGLSDGVSFEGNWIGGIMIKEMIIRNLTGTTGTVFKKESLLTFNSRFYCDANADIPTGWSFADFETSNFVNEKTFQLQNMMLSRAGVFDDTDIGYLPNISEEDVKSDFKNNVGLKNSSLFFEKFRSPNGTVYKLEVDDSGDFGTGGGGGGGDFNGIETSDTPDIELTGDGTENDKLKAELTQAVKDDIAEGVTANGWGNHSSAGYQLVSNIRQNLSSPNATTYPSTQAVHDALLAGIPKEEDITGTRYTNTSTSGVLTFDMDSYKVFDLVLTGNTDFQIQNPPTGTETKVIEGLVTGDHGLGLPANWVPFPNNDDYIGSMTNHIVVTFIKSGNGGIFYSLQNII